MNKHNVFIERDFCIDAHKKDSRFIVGHDLLEHAVELDPVLRSSNVVLIVDEKLCSAAQALQRGIGLGTCQKIIPIGASEGEKSLETAQQLWQLFFEARVDRGSLIVALGGGMLCDLVGFAASLFHRGISVVYFPSTLLAMADAALGGKTAVNFGGAKNILGTYKLPHLVVCDLSLLATLAPREISAGYAEIIKIALMRDANFFTLLEQASGLEIGRPEKIAEIVGRAAELKLEIVARDFEEKGERRVLNFGHTVGHAFEACALQRGLDLKHGEAVALGMVVETAISAALGNCDSALVPRIINCLKSYSLPTRTALAREPEVIWSLIGHDKKMSAGQLRWTLPLGVGSSIERTDIHYSVFAQALQQVATEL